MSSLYELHCRQAGKEVGKESYEEGQVERGVRSDVKQEALLLLQRLGRVQPWNLAASVSVSVYRERAYGVFAFLADLVRLHPEVDALSQIRTYHYAEVLGLWEYEGMPAGQRDAYWRVMCWLYDVLTDPEDSPYEEEAKTA